MIQILLLRPDGKGSTPHRHPYGFPNGLVVSNSNAVFANLPAILEKLRSANPENLKNCFYTVAHHSGLDADRPSRTKLTFEKQTVLQFDIDHADTGRAWEYLPLAAGILGVTPANLVFICSGNGLHILAHLATPIRSNKFLEETKPHYNELVYRLNQTFKKAGLPGTADPAVWDAPRILRLPGTVNEKNGVSKDCVLLQDPGQVPLELDIIKLSGLDKLDALNIKPEVAKRTYPRPDFQEVIRECRFLKSVIEHPETVHEPHFMTATGILSAMAPEDRALYHNQLVTPKELAQGIFNAAGSSKSLQGVEFEAKWEHGIRYGAPKCSTVGNAIPGICETCPHQGKIATPLALKSQEHISSSEDGFWVMGKNGPVHPHYGDLAKVYQGAFPYVTCIPDRVFIYKDGFYLPTSQLEMKGWLDKKVGHPDKLRDAHCTEFVKKVMRDNILSEDREKALFETSIKGKLNCKNGVVDIIQGKLIPHSDAWGFKYCLPYDFDPDATSELFIDWLAQVMDNRTELMDSVLDMMAYCLWPTYDDHVFAYLVGEGRNGKSTLLRIMQAVLGRDNYEAISLAQLGGNRFAPAHLEGKLANISEESSGTDLSLEETNTIKNLSAGGELQVEHKGERAFMMRNSAKLIFSANKTPRFHEQGLALKSRLLVIPFDHTFASPDENIALQLIADAPNITPMLVRRLQDNLRVNGGKIKVSRGGAAAATAQEKVLLAGNSAVEWGKECLLSSLDIPESNYITCKEAYDRYKIWCLENNYKQMNSVNFGNTMVHGVLTSAIKQSRQIKVGGKNLRIYPHTQWKEESL
jgi:P4 family phage/plasmid primase-like protien